MEASNLNAVSEEASMSSVAGEMEDMRSVKLTGTESVFRSVGDALRSMGSFR